MSKIFEIADDLSNLPAIIAEYDQEIENAKDNLDLEGKTLFEANREQPSWYCHYYRLLQELKTIEDFVEGKLEAKKGKLWRDYKENHTLSLSSTDITHYINSTPAYEEIRTLHFVVIEMVGMMNALVKAFEQRGYVLRNLTEARIHEMQTATI